MTRGGARAENQRRQTLNPSSAQRPLPSPVLGTITFVVLAGIAPLLVLANTPTTGYTTWPGTLIIAILAAARFSWAVSSRTRHLVEMVISLFTYGFLGIAPLVQLRERAQVNTTPNFATEFAFITIVIIVVGFGCICLGSALATVRAPDVTSRVRPPQRVSTKRVVLVTLFAFAMMGYYLSKVGPASLALPRIEFETEIGTIFPDTTTAAIVIGFATMSMLVALVAQITLYRQRRREGLKAPLPLLLITAVTLLLVVNPISSARYPVGTIYLATIAALGIWGAMRRYRTVSIATLGGLFFLFPIASTFRYTLSSSVKFQSPLESLLSGDFDAFDQINNTAYFVSLRGITWGDQLLGVLFFWVPRSVWDGKAIDTGVLLAQFRGYSFKNLSAPLWAEFFINGGWPLLILGMILVGFFARRWDARLDAQITATGTPTILGCIVPFYLLIVLRGSLLQSMASLAVILLLSWFVGGGKSSPKEHGAQQRKTPSSSSMRKPEGVSHGS